MTPSKSAVIFSLDCVRPEALGCYGERMPAMLHASKFLWNGRGARRLFPLYSRALDPLLRAASHPRTPHIDRLAANAVRYTQAITQAPFTPVAHASLFTGLTPPNHGVRRFIGDKLAPGCATLAERCRDAGFRTAAFVGANVLGPAYGLNRGFETYEMAEGPEPAMRDATLTIQRRDGQQVAASACRWLEARAPNERFLLFIHLFDAHEDDSALSYQPFVHLRRVRAVDAAVGTILETLRQRGLDADCAVALAADHGNDFGLHEPGHRWYVFDPTLRIPLVVRAPGLGGGTARHEQVRLVDIAPTLWQALGFPAWQPPAGTDPATTGQSLYDLSGDRPAYSETFFEESATKWDQPLHSYASLRSPPHKLVLDRRTDHAALYDLLRDPHERLDASAAQPDAAARLAAQVRALANHDAGARMTDTDVAQITSVLHDLGYL